MFGTFSVVLLTQSTKGLVWQPLFERAIKEKTAQTCVLQENPAHFSRWTCFARATRPLRLHVHVLKTECVCRKSLFSRLNMWIFKNDNSRHSCAYTAGLFLRETPSCSSCIRRHAPRCMRRLQCHWRRLHVICRLWHSPINTRYSARSVYQKDIPKGREVFGFQLMLPSLHQRCHFPCLAMQRGLGQLCRDHVWEEVNLPRRLGDT